MILNDLAPALSLDGGWSFALGEGAARRWGTVAVPGCWEAQGWDKWTDGPACYRREVFVPATWREQAVFVEFDAVSYAAQVICNGQPLAEHRGLWTPFAVDLSRALQPGQLNTLELIVHKPTNALTGGRYPLRSTLAGFLPDVATTFGGIWQPARLRAFAAGFQDVQVDPDLDSSTVRLRGRAVDLAASTRSLACRAEITCGDAHITVADVSLDPNGEFDVAVPVPNAGLWSPETPILYTARFQLARGDDVVAAWNIRFGFRRLAADGERLLLNGAPICLRGALSWGWEPDAIAPFYTAEQVRAEFRRVRSLGFNLVKLCLFVPNQTYYDIADEEGMLLWQEWPMWLPTITEELRRLAPTEYAAYMRLARHHPSVVVHSVGCELSHAVDEPLLRRLDRTVRSHAAGALVCDNSGSAEAYGGLAVDLADFADYHTYGELHFLEPSLDHWRRDWQAPRPWIFGEFCDCDGFRDLDAIVAANGGTKPWWMTSDIPVSAWRPETVALIEAEERLARAALDRTPRALVEVAAAQSYVVRKYTLEAVRRRRGVQGYVVTGLRDTPIATSGVIDDLGHPKWPPEAFRQFNDDAILCLDVGRSRAWQHGGDRPERLDVHCWAAGTRVRLYIIANHTRPQPVSGAVLEWQTIRLDGTTLASGTITCARALPLGCPAEAGVIEFDLPFQPEAEEFNLFVVLRADDFTCSNHWPLWSFPAAEPAWPAGLRLVDPPDLLPEYRAFLPAAARLEGADLAADTPVILTSVLDDAVCAYLRGGGRALLLQFGDGPLPARRGPFWREAIKLLADAPLWRAFPQRGYTDLQFWGLATDVMFDTAHLRDVLPDATAVRPLLRRLDARQFTISDYVLEARVGDGHLIACTLRLHGGQGAQPTGLARNVAGAHLLRLLLDDLAQG